MALKVIKGVSKLCALPPGGKYQSSKVNYRLNLFGKFK